MSRTPVLQGALVQPPPWWSGDPNDTPWMVTAMAAGRWRCRDVLGAVRDRDTDWWWEPPTVERTYHRSEAETRTRLEELMDRQRETGRPFARLEVIRP